MTIRWRFPLYKQALICLLLAAVFFFLSYGLTNHYAASLEIVPSISYDWEKYIPFVSWTIIPYWSLDILYGVSFFLCLTKQELSVHTARLLLASCFCCTCFMLFPLSCSSEIPFITVKIFKWLFDVLPDTQNTMPYNQAPSLHITLAWLVWLRFRAHTSGYRKILIGSWFILIGISVLTCYQHHFIDVPLGLATGVVISYLLPTTSFSQPQELTDPKRWKLGCLYLAGAVLLAISAYLLKGWGWFLLWPSASLSIVVVGYLLCGTKIFQKDSKGTISPSAKILFAPYHFVAKLSRWYFMRHIPPYSQITEQVYLGSLPSGSEIYQDYILDITAEFDSSTIKCSHKETYPCLDLLALTPSQLQEGAQKLLRLSKNGTTLVCCALGLSRSVAIVAAYLISCGKFSSVEQAIKFIQKKRPPIVLSRLQINYLIQWKHEYNFIRREN